MSLPKIVQRLRMRAQLDVGSVGLAPLGVPGPSAGTLRDASIPFRWSGLSVRDRHLLGEFLGGLAVRPDELHTHVPVGRLPAIDDGELDEFTRGQLEALWPRRIDAMLRFGGDWWLIECKPDANHYVLGQVLCYAFWLARDCAAVNCSRVIVVTDQCDPEVLPVLQLCGVQVVEVGR